MSLKSNGWFPIRGGGDMETKSHVRLGAETGVSRTGGGHWEARREAGNGFLLCCHLDFGLLASRYVRE